MIRGAIAVGSVGTIITGLLVTGHHPHARSASAGSATPAPTVSPTRVSRAEPRLPLRVVKPAVAAGKARHDLPKRVARPATAAEHLLDVTAYCATGNRTASGMWPQIGMAAGNRWPFGTRLRIDGYGTVVVEDRIGWGSDVDLYFGAGPDCEQRASVFGRQHRAVAVVR